MNQKKKIIGICGSACRNSENLAILNYKTASEKSDFDILIGNE